MKILLFSLLMPSILTAAASSSQGNPNDRHESETRRRIIRMVKQQPTTSSAIDIPKPPSGHARKRSNTHEPVVFNDLGVSPPEASSVPAPRMSASCSGSAETWVSSPKDKFLYDQPTRHTFAGHRPRKLTEEEKETKWRQMRSAAFGRKHKRTASLPSAKEFGTLYFMMELSEEYDKQLEAKGVQEKFIERSQDLNDLCVLLDTGVLQECIESIKKGQKSVAQIELLITRAETLAQKCEKLVLRMDGLAEQHVPQEAPTSPRIERRKSKPSVMSIFHGSGQSDHTR